jgi:hypothetical protein
MSTTDTGEYHVFALVTEIDQSKCSIYFMIFERVEDVFFDPKNTFSFMFLSIIHSEIQRTFPLCHFVSKYFTSIR